MASNELLDVSFRSKSLRDVLAMKTVSDAKFTTQNTYKTQERYFKEKVTLTLSSPSFGAVNQFEINRSEGFIGGTYLELNMTGAVTCGQLLGFNSIDDVEIQISGNRIFQYSGEALFMYLCAVNPDKNIRDYIAEIGGGAALTTTAPATSLYIPIVGPGFNGIIKHRDVGTYAQPYFPIGKANTDVIYRIRLKATTELETTSVLAISSMKLHYFKAKIAGDNAVATTSSGKQVIWSQNVVHLRSDYYIRSQTSGADDVIDLSNINDDGDLQAICFMSVIDGEYSTAKDHFDSQAIAQCSLEFKGSKKIYEQTTVLESTWLSCLNTGEKNVFPQTATRFYFCPISPAFANNPIAYPPAANLHLEQLNLRIKAIATDTVKVSVVAWLQSVINLTSDRVVDEITVPN